MFSCFQSVLRPTQGRIDESISLECPVHLPEIHKFLVAQLTSLEEVDEKAQLYANVGRNPGQHAKVGHDGGNILDLSVEDLTRLRVEHQAAALLAQNSGGKKGNGKGKAYQTNTQGSGSAQNNQPPAASPQTQSAAPAQTPPTSQPIPQPAGQPNSQRSKAVEIS